METEGDRRLLKEMKIGSVGRSCCGWRTAVAKGERRCWGKGTAVAGLAAAWWVTGGGLGGAGAAGCAAVGAGFPLLLCFGCRRRCWRPIWLLKMSSGDR
ncbi:hypothetical protein NC653_030667 [Populus alba x Populus x berolinensis]|uniref:Uncharacterized protein n=1 Tax=Populus alba x Populus x berolinensis TaxID=444605 RepID=A0AAD6Q0N6_9ROSI|nr:hypothetical protein NC653_030667 [Populus alba x Populus x berolinensis]